MVFAVRDEMSVAYPELKETAERVARWCWRRSSSLRVRWSLGLQQMNEETLAFRVRRRSIFMKRSACRWTSWSMRRAMRALQFDMAGFEAAKEEEQAARAGFVEGWVAEVGGAGLSRAAEDGV